MPVERLTPDRHLHLIEGIFGHIISVQLIDLPDDGVDVRLLWFREEKELCPRYGLEACETEEGAL